MKIATSFLGGLLLIGSLGAINSAMAADDGVSEKVPLAADSYCHEQFSAIQGRTLGTDDPTLKNDGDVIDYYGPCSEQPTGKDQQWEQQLEREHRYENSYED